MGTGKTVVGRLLAERLGYDFFDTDQVVEKETGRKISEIFEKEGEPAFRLLEKKILLRGLGRKNIVIATGGGAVLDPDNLNEMKGKGVLIALTTSPEEIFERLKALEDRPLLKGENRMGKIKKLLSRRSPYYEQADHIVNCEGKEVREIVETILKRLNENS